MASSICTAAASPGNTAPTGAGVNNEGTFNLYGGTISDNTATYSWGGGVYNAGTLVMNCDPAEKTIFNNHTASGTSAMGTEVHTPSGGSFDLRSGWISGSTPGVSAVGLASEMQLNGTIRIDGGVQLVDMCYDKLNVTDKFAPQAPIQILLNSGWKGSQYFKNYSLAQSVLNSFTTDSGKVFILDDSNAIQLAIPVDFNAADSRPQLTAGSLTYTGKEQTGVKLPNAAAAVMYTPVRLHGHRRRQLYSQGVSERRLCVEGRHRGDIFLRGQGVPVVDRPEDSGGR